MSRPEILRQKAAYERGRQGGFDLSQQEARVQTENDMWMFGGSGIALLCTFSWFLSRRAHTALQHVEKIRDETATLLALKEKEMSMENAQVRHLQSMHHEYLSRTQRQEQLIKRLRERGHDINRKMRQQKAAIVDMRKKISSATVLVADRKMKLEELRGARNVVTLETRHMGHTFAGVSLCMSMWITFQFAQR